MTKIDAVTIAPSEYPVRVTLRAHDFTADVGTASGGNDTAPGAHDLFDAALATCKAHTAMWYAKYKKIPLERVEAHVESDNTDERKGTYRFKVRVELVGDAMTPEQRAAVLKAIEACPVHKLMTTSDVVIEVVPA